ncbi:lysophospholipid acyltransferase family protein [Harryflintia acetispora]|uniref:1-acyl-sn-glycerol-3-phosphate acyltransferase n=1 Tax=Harryflintia acetispora TaxID=1849041 RepID=A0A9X8Y8J9_9FIRM|nr:lysophospholipid acyltransferase family protein [Harryflintia acetispora]TCL43696.1 1-acyl-sn-glycerol-3-phosphate acyltransferase [Harryflintia acetispora]
MFYRFARNLLHFFFWFAFKIDAEGRENLPKDKGFIVASNHRSNCDPIFIGVMLKPNLTFMAKIELFQLPVIGRLFYWLGAFPVERGKGDTGAVDFAIKTVEEGKILAMFPEGTRSLDGKLLRPKSGCALIAGASGADVVPTAVCFGEKLRFRSHITVKFGKPISREELGVSASSPATIKAASRLIMSRIQELLDSAEDRP